MKTILVPTDFSEVANNAALFAFKLAKKSNARVILLHTYNLPFTSGQMMNFDPTVLYENIDLNEFELFKENNQILYKLAEERNIQINEMYHKLVLGELITTIKECIKVDNVDFVVMGTSGGDDWFSKILGTNTDSVITSLQVPTLIIPKDFQDDELETIGFTTRFRDKDKPALIKTIDFAKKLGLSVKGLYSQEEESESETTLIASWKEEFESSNVDFVVTPSNNDVLNAIQFFITHYSIDILVMVSYKRDFFTELFTQRFTQKVSHNIAIPLLVLHE
ncbi:MAG: universal stress protein [Limnohabitans sp.]|nr:universal stress protein [Limnohabitans sp.]